METKKAVVIAGIEKYNSKEGVPLVKLHMVFTHNLKWFSRSVTEEEFNKFNLNLLYVEEEIPVYEPILVEAGWGSKLEGFSLVGSLQTTLVEL